MKHFSLSMESIIYIYGAGSMGIKIYRILEKHKIMVKNFFDKNADKINLDANINCPIYLLENYDGNIDNKSIAIISLLNANNHDEIALELYKKGFKNIIYIPMPGKSLISNYHSNLLRIAFSNLIDEKLEKLRALPVYYLPKLKHESLIIDNSDIITVWIPVVLLFTASDDIIENYLRENKICDCVINGSNKSIFLSQIIKLFDWFEKGKTDLSQIRKEYTINGKSAMCSSDDAWFRYIEDRLELYYSFKNALNFDYAFFINSPILVKYNERGYFNIIDGHHRASFLAMNNFKEIPVRISKEDYYKWENKELYFKILNYINNYDDIIINPNFHKKINKENDYKYYIFSDLQKFFIEYDLKDKKVLINEKGNLFYSLLFYFNGCMVTNIESASQHKLNVLLRRLYNTNGIKILDIDIRDIDEKEKFDIIYLKNVFENKKYEYSIINKITNEFFILELENEREKDIIIENTDFKSYFPLRKILSKNRQCEVGIFKK